MYARALLLAILVLPSVGCGPRFLPPAPHDPPPDRSYEASFDRVWNAVLETVTDLEVPVENLEKASGFLRSDFMRFPEAEWHEFMDCGEVSIQGTMWPVARRQGFRPRARITVLARELEGGVVSVRLRALMRGISGDGVTYDCESTGRIEELFFDSFEHRLQGRR